MPTITRFRLLALDVDGTLLDPGGKLRPRTAEAVARASAAGIRPVLCTGRRYRRARPVAIALGLDAPIVCNSGSLVKEPERNETLWRADLPPDVLALLLALLRRLEQPAVSIVDHAEEAPDLLAPGHPIGRELFDDYVARNLEYVGIEPGWMERPDAGSHFHIFAIGERERMLEVEAQVLAALPGRVRTFVQRSPHYRGTMCEVLRHDASKWSAVLHVAQQWGVDPSEVVAVGDDMNDIPMIEGAGLGVAMGHAPAIVREAADLVTEDHDRDGLARLIDDVLLR